MMATVSRTATALTTPPATSHGNKFTWDSASVPVHSEKPVNSKRSPINNENSYPFGRPVLASQKRNSTLLATHNTSPMDSLSHDHYTGDVADDDTRFTNSDSAYVVPSHHKDLKPRSARDGGSPADSLFDPETDESKWIHRDKLAQIENEELQAAGFVLPVARDNRARSKSGNRLKRDQSQDKLSGQARSIGSGGEHVGSRSRKNSSATQDWDKRADDGAEHADYSTSNPGAKVTSRIPVPRTKAYPTTPTDEKAAAFARKRDSSPEEDKEKIAYPKTRGRSGSTGNALTKAANGSDARPTAKRADTSPMKSKPAAGAKKVSGKAATTTTARPRTRGASNKDSTGARPTTRSGDRELSPTTHKPMEGEPPWMVSAFRPDPRLPPEQQLLPTVAKRLQQEKWEREGKVGNVYDKEFRPLTDEGFLEPPEHPIVAPEHEAAENEKENENEEEQEKENEMEQPQADWPLKPAEPQCPQSPPPPSLHSLQSPRSPAPVGRTNSYSTMPKIADKPVLTKSPSPKNPPQPPHPSQVIRVPEPPEDPPQKKEKGGCGCCIVM